MDFFTPEMVTGLLDRGWQGVVTILVLRWFYRERKARKNGKEANGNGNKRRLTDHNPGNPHSWFERIENNCKRHESTMGELQREMKKDKKEIVADLRDVRERAIKLEIEARQKREAGN